MTDPTPAAPEPAAGQPARPLNAAEDKQWASFAHFGNLILLVPALIIYVVFGPRGSRTKVEGKEALNWTINVTGAIIIVQIVSTILAYVPYIGGILFLLLTLVFWAIVIVNLIFAIMGGLRVNAGGSYRYPINIRWIK